MGSAAVKREKRLEKRYPAYYEDYIRCLIRLHSEPRRCLISDNVLVDDEGEKTSIFSKNVLSKCISEATDNPRLKFIQYMFEHHFYKLKSKLKPEILIDAPAWDGFDRLKLFAHCMKYRNCTQEQAEEAIKDWGASMIRKWHDDRQQNHVLIFHGAQGIGKDTKLVRALTGYLGQYLKHLTITRSGADKELWITLRNAGCINISEFDRISKMESSVIKDMVHKEQADVVLKFENEVTTLRIRTSFIATTNTTDVYRGDAGDRRYILFEVAGEKNDLDAIGLSHEDIDEEFQAQVYAQYWELYREGYRMSVETRDNFYAYNLGQSPDVYHAQMMEEFDEIVLKLAHDTNQFTEDGHAYILASDEQLTDLCDKLTRKYGTFPGRGPQINKFKNYLKETGRYGGRINRVNDDSRNQPHFYVSLQKPYKQQVQDILF